MQLTDDAWGHLRNTRDEIANYSEIAALKRFECVKIGVPISAQLRITNALHSMTLQVCIQTGLIQGYRRSWVRPELKG